MAEKRQTLDVWVVESNTVYREVPFSVVTDWVEQGRLLDDDKVRSAGGKEWVRLADMASLAPYVPKAEPYRVGDQAEALEPVHVDFAWRKRREFGDEDVDMIPLIDVSLVLLVFFMMTAAVGGAASIIDTPIAEYRLFTNQPEMWWLGMVRDSDGQARYSMGKGDRAAPTAYASRDEMLRALGQELETQSAAVDVRIRADRRLPIEVIRDMTVELEKFKTQGKIHNVLGEVSEKQQP